MRFFLLALGLFLVRFFAQAQEMGNAQYGNNRTHENRNFTTDVQVHEDGDIELKIQGLFNVLPTQYVAVFNVLQIGQTQVETERLMRERLAIFTRGLAKAGFDSTTFRVDVISLVPRYETQATNRPFSKRYNEVPAGFELQKTISIPYRHTTNTNTVLALAGQAEIYDLVKVDCTAPDVQKSKDELRAACIAAFKAKEATYIAAGFRLDTMPKTFAETSGAAYPVTRYTSYQAAARPSFDALSRLLSFGKVTVNQAAQTTAYYYAPVANDQYDVVLNPVVTQPVIQYTYSFVARYQSRPHRQLKNKYYFLNTDGKAVQLEVE